MSCSVVDRGTLADRVDDEVYRASPAKGSAAVRSFRVLPPLGVFSVRPAIWQLGDCALPVWISVRAAN